MALIWFIIIIIIIIINDNSSLVSLVPWRVLKNKWSV